MKILNENTVRGRNFVMHVGSERMPDKRFSRREIDSSRKVKQLIIFST